jgi:hypothetical protein
MRPSSIVLLFFALLFAVPALAQNSIPNDVVGSGGGVSSGGGLTLHDTMGQPVIGVTSGATGANKIGYWYSVDNLHIGPTSEVLITAFEVKLSKDGVTLGWTLGGSTELEGFNVYRAENEAGEYEKLNSQLISPGEGNSYLDAGLRPGRTYWYRLGAVDRDGESFSLMQMILVPPRDLELHQNYPNPFNPVTTLSFYMPEAQHVSLVIYDVLGRRVRSLLEENMQYGGHEVLWDGRNDKGELVGSGVYFYRLVAGKNVFTRKLTLLK